MTTIRPLNEADSLVELTALLHRSYAKLSAMGLNYTAVDQSVETTARRVSSGVCFVAMIEQELVGTILVRPTHEASHCEFFTQAGVATAHQFAVDPSRQGTGVGRMLLDRAEQWARDHDFLELAIDTAEKAEHLIQFFSRLGYRRVGVVEWPGKVYRSAVMSKRLR